jgi:hypothetical protein
VPLDVAGCLLLVVGLILLLLGIGGQPGSSISGRLAFGSAGAAVLGVWALWELRQRVPLVDVRLMGRAQIWPVNVVGALIGFGMYATGFLVPQLVQADPDATGVGFGASVTTTSLYLLPALASGLVAGTASGVLARSLGAALPFGLGLGAMGLGYVVLIVGLHTPLAVAAGALIAHGLGLNVALAAMANLVLHEAPHDRLGEAAGVNATVRTIGGALGIQIVAVVLIAPGGEAGIPSTAGFDLAFGICAALMVAGLALLFSRRPGRRRDLALADVHRSG